MARKKRVAKYSKEFLAKLRSVKAKRPRTVIDHILKHGHITTEVLKEKYGYNHPPRAARDVKEQGIPLEMFKVVGGDVKLQLQQLGGLFVGRFLRLLARWLWNYRGIVFIDQKPLEISGVSFVAFAV